MKNMVRNVFLLVTHPAPMGPALPHTHAPVTRGTVGLIVRRRVVQGAGGGMGAFWNASVRMGGNAMLLMEHVTVLMAFMDPYVKINAMMERSEKVALESVTAPQVTLAITLVENVSSVQMTHLETNVSKLVTVIRMELLCVLMLMEDVSVRQTGLEQNVILNVLLVFWMEIVFSI